MSGVVDSKGQQWEHCSYCNRFVKFPQNLGYQKPNNLLPYGRDICVICADIGIRTGWLKFEEIQPSPSWQVYEEK